MLDILESKKLTFAPKNIDQFDRVNQSFEVLEDMKKLFSHKDFLLHIADLLEQPFAIFSNKINKTIRDNKFQNLGYQK
jgi:hypothetical protein